MVAERGLQAHASWLNKCIQLYETYLVRHGIMLVGPSGAGKTAIMECLAAALTELGTKHVIWRMNPKARTLLPLLVKQGCVMLGSGMQAQQCRAATHMACAAVKLVPSLSA